MLSLKNLSHLETTKMNLLYLTVASVACYGVTDTNNDAFIPGTVGERGPGHSRREHGHGEPRVPRFRG